MTVTPTDVEVVPGSGQGSALPAGLVQFRAERISSWVHTEHFRTAQLPPICVHTGTPADEWMAMAVKSRIGAQWLLLLIGVFPLVLVRVLTVKRATGYLPINRAEMTRIGREVLGMRKRRFRRLAVRFLVVGMVLTTIAAMVGIVYLAREKADWEGAAASHLAAAQRDWDAAAKVLPHDEVSDDHVTAWSMGANGCIVSSERYFDDDYMDNTMEYCRPERSGFTGIELRLNRPSEVANEYRYGVVEFDLVDYDVYDGEVSLRSRSSFGYLISPLNLAAPVVAAGSAAFLVALLGGAVIALGGPKVPRIQPKAHLDRSGDRLHLIAHRNFVAAAQPQVPQMVVVLPGSVPVAPSLPPGAIPGPGPVPPGLSPPVPVGPVAPPGPPPPGTSPVGPPVVAPSVAPPALPPVHVPSPAEPLDDDGTKWWQ